MKRYLLNSAVITAPGTYVYDYLSPEQAREWYGYGPVISTIGYAETAAALSDLLGADIPVNKVNIVMYPGDEALVFRLVLPPGTPRLNPQDKGRISQIVHAGHWELGLLKRVD
ncbi:MAG: hypothetical protein KatS3mg038_3205 [Candidatus Kapaibacterium sp.]|nr:MAG: hypothetical protein KatS3mg038_1925 [Candidatus Kapabacteria bacterium]GIV51927.1 MAG: hypothetical protein KatS3mg038_2448 [Candidatus Kapabacteria bacterium]GIV52627.1 MAG: hypothetical protein KatS3mg038_3148 [Candidatus Kapabacteria bacterium]GIV52684.1 MAG: hypothetical protein KatS3mg038_3205 [Candidatus Kapabacteria bacterium]